MLLLHFLIYGLAGVALVIILFVLFIILFLGGHFDKMLGVHDDYEDWHRP